MKLSRKINKFQEGGAMEDPNVAPTDAGAETAVAPEQESGADPLTQLALMAMEALQSQDCSMAMQVCDAFVQMLQQAPAPQGEPVFRKGGKLAYRLK